ncbi:MAG TPA: HypC/HybG/HupF family hydrogenase formation chaperone [Polyangiaceae bacterium]|nr:HypC/HybG/HupF family hydrogenase formation chaperone [Polyangiaceae bacterium]
MCLGAPGRVVEIEGMSALVDFGGVRRKVALDIVDDPVCPGDYVLVHVGFAIRRIAPQDVAMTLAFFEAMAGGEEGLPPHVMGPEEPS